MSEQAVSFHENILCRKVKTLNWRPALTQDLAVAISILLHIDLCNNSEVMFVDNRPAKICLPVSFHTYNGSGLGYSYKLNNFSVSYF
jgi:hypothetical protein